MMAYLYPDGVRSPGPSIGHVSARCRTLAGIRRGDVWVFWWWFFFLLAG